MKWKADLITVIVEAEKKEMKEKEGQLDHERKCHIEAVMEAVKCEHHILDVSPLLEHVTNLVQLFLFL